MNADVGKFLVHHGLKKYDLILAVADGEIPMGVYADGTDWVCAGMSWEISETIPEGYVRDGE